MITTGLISYITVTEEQCNNDYNLYFNSMHTSLAVQEGLSVFASDYDCEDGILGTYMKQHPSRTLSISVEKYREPIIASNNTIVVNIIHQDLFHHIIVLLSLAAGNGLFANDVRPFFHSYFEDYHEKEAEFAWQRRLAEGDYSD